MGVYYLRRPYRNCNTIYKIVCLEYIPDGDPEYMWLRFDESFWLVPGTVDFSGD